MRRIMAAMLAAIPSASFDAAASRDAEASEAKRMPKHKCVLCRRVIPPLFAMRRSKMFCPEHATQSARRAFITKRALGVQVMHKAKHASRNRSGGNRADAT